MKNTKKNNLVKPKYFLKPRLRPSSLQSLLDCPYAWFVTSFIGVPSPQFARATLGSAIHHMVEKMWEDKKAKRKSKGTVEYTAEAIRYFSLEVDRLGKDLIFRSKETKQSLIKALKKACPVILHHFKDIKPPKHIERFLEVEIDTPYLKSFGGSIDYLGATEIRDIKTSSSEVSSSSYSLQQSAYMYLANRHGFKVKDCYLDCFKISSSGEVEVGVVKVDLKLNKISQIVSSVVVALGDVLTIKDGKVVPAKGVHFSEAFVTNDASPYCNSYTCSLYGKCPATSANKKAYAKDIDCNAY